MYLRPFGQRIRTGHCRDWPPDSSSQEKDVYFINVIIYFCYSVSIFIVLVVVKLFSFLIYGYGSIGN